MTAEQKKAKRRAYYEKNREHELANAKRWQAKNRERLLEYQKARHKRRREIERIYNRNRIRTSIPAYLSNVLSKRLNRAARDHGFRRCARAKELLGCSIEYLIKHLESNFSDGMIWENRGQWHVDHIVPCASFDLTKPENQRACFHWTNLQPLWAKDNRTKKNRIGEETSIICIETGQTFDCSSIAAEATGANRRSILAVCHGKRITAGGYHWRYA